MTTVFIEQQGNHVIARDGNDDVVTVLYNITKAKARLILSRRRDLDVR